MTDLNSKPPLNKRCGLYPPIENFGVIGNLRTVALSGNGSIDFMCYPVFDSPSIFARLLDHEQGGHFQIFPTETPTIKQQYQTSSNILTTRFLTDTFSMQIDDFMHHPTDFGLDTLLLPWLIRTVSVPRGKVQLNIECFPSFDYARSQHTSEFFEVTNIEEGVGDKGVRFISKDLSMDLRYTYKPTEGFDRSCFQWDIETPSNKKFKGPGVIATLELSEGQEFSMILSMTPNTGERSKFGFAAEEPKLTSNLVHKLFKETSKYWQNWASGSTYKGRWRESVLRSALTLKLLTYAPTGAIVAAPTFSLPEEVGGERNWDYRYCWVRDSSFTIYAFIRLGFTEEAKGYMKYIQTLLEGSQSNGALFIMYSIHGSSDLKEFELDHLAGYRHSQPVRIGNGAATHLQLDIYGELLDAVYLYNKFVEPISYELWLLLRRVVDYVCDNWNQPDMSIWEVRNKQQNFLYSKIMCWVAVDRGIRLSIKRTLPCPNREIWLKTRDTIYEEVMTKGWNNQLLIFSQSYESPDCLDASVLVMPLVFFISPTDPRFIDTINRILLPLEKGGLVSNNLVYRYNHQSSQDGLSGGEGSFAMCTFWLVEALTRIGKYRPHYLPQAIAIFEQMLGYANHVNLFSEEIAPSGELLGNFPQAFTHIALISAAFNLNRVLK